MKVSDWATEPAPRAVQRRVGASVVILAAMLFGWAVFKHVMTGDLADSKIDAGMTELAAAIVDSDSSRFEAAEDYFVDAASVSVVDVYPAFLIRTGRRLRDGGAEDAHDEIANLISRRDFVGARRLATTMESSSKRSSVFWLRFIDDLESRVD